MLLGTKKAQVTVFIIVGIVLVLGISTFFMLRTSNVKDQFDEQGQQIVVERVSAEFRPVQDYVTQCVTDLGTQGLRLLGQQGGYIDVSGLRTNKLDPTSTGANALVFWPEDEDFKIPYWWYMDSSDDCFSTFSCRFSSEQPRLEGSADSIETQLEEYIDENLAGCLDEFKPLKNQGFRFLEQSDPETDVTFTKDDVFIELDYPVTSLYDRKEQELTFYNTRLDVSFREMYEFASELVSLQQSGAFLERQLIDIISLYSGTDQDALLPPFYNPAALRGTGDIRLVWTRNEVKKAIQSLLPSYVPMFSVYHSRNFRMRSGADDYDSAFFEKMVIPINDSDYVDYDVDFSYKSWWDLYLNIDDLQVMQPESSAPKFLKDIPLVGPVLNQFSPLRYQFAYDVSYPVMMTLSDPDAFGGDGFTMNVAMETNVRNNMPVFETENELEQQAAAGIPASLTRSIFCSIENFDSGNVTAIVKDARSGDELEGANVNYICAQESCYMGMTKSHDDGIYFKGQFPVCVGGMLEVQLAGYERKTVPLSTQLDQGDDMEVMLEPVREKQIKVRVFGNKKRTLFNSQTAEQETQWSIDFTNEEELRPGETAMITFERVPEDGASGSSDEFSSIAYMTYDNPVADVRLVPGTYEVTGTLIVDFTAEESIFSPVTIPGETRPVKTGLFKEPEKVELPPIEFEDMFPESMLFLDEAHGGYWEVTADQLDSADTITFYMIASPYLESGLQLSYDDMNEFGKSDYYSGVHRDLIEPCIGSCS